MKQLHLYALALVLVVSAGASAQVPIGVNVKILQAEDARRYDESLAKLLNDANPSVRTRAALAAGRIGDPEAVEPLVRMLTDADPQTREMAAFALGEIESVTAADAILKAIGETARAQVPGAREPENGNRARLVEAAGKIAAANAQHAKAKDLGAAVVFTLEAELDRGTGHHKATVLQALTAALRARPAGSEAALRKFLAFTDPDIVATALNTLARLRAKNANRDARDLMATHLNAIVRANAARLLGAAEDKEAVDGLIKAATSDADSRVRVSAIRSLAALRDTRSADPLLTHGEKVFAQYKAKHRKGLIPDEQNEFIEVAVALGRILADSSSVRAKALIREFGKLDQGTTPEPYVAALRIGMGDEQGSSKPPDMENWHQFSTFAQMVGELAVVEPKTEGGKKMKAEAPEVLRIMAKAAATADPAGEGKKMLATPDLLQAFARFKTSDLAEITRTALKNKGIQLRAAAAGILADMPASPENIAALRAAFEYARANDTENNDAMLSITSALIKLDRNGSLQTWSQAILSPDHIVRRRVRDELPAEIKKITAKDLLFHVNKPLGPGTRMGQILNSHADYRRAAMRKNGGVKAVLTTQKGTFTIDLLPEGAPLTVDNFVKLARLGYFNGLEVHRVVPNFVMQDGDPRGDGNGGPGWSIRCEVNMLPYGRGAVGMALSGKDTGGSQWFVTHSPQPHLDGGYTVFGKVNEIGMKVVDKIVRGDKILKVMISGR